MGKLFYYWALCRNALVPILVPVSALSMCQSVLLPLSLFVLRSLTLSLSMSVSVLLSLFLFASILPTPVRVFVVVSVHVPVGALTNRFSWTKMVSLIVLKRTWRKSFSTCC